MLGRIAKLYYDHDLTHQQVADIVGWSRVKVTRALAEAREQGIVQITVHSDEAIFLETEQALGERFGELQSIHVGPPSNDPTKPDPLIRSAAHYVSGLINNDMQVAVGLSTTLAAVAAALPQRQLPGTTFVPLHGTNPGLVTPPTPSNIAREFGSTLGGQVHVLAAPVFTSSTAAHEVLADDEYVKGAFETARRSDLALVGVGGIAEGSSIVLSGNLTNEEADELRSAGAVGDVNARFYDARGEAVQTERTSLVLGLTLDEFKDIPLRVAVGAGEAKVDALRAAIRGNIINGLITDEPTAQALLAG